jgi:hypothetical protein
MMIKMAQIMTHLLRVVFKMGARPLYSYRVGGKNDVFASIYVQPNAEGILCR